MGTLSRDAVLAELTGAGQPYELETVTMYGRPVRAFKQAPPTLRDLFANARSDATFLVYEDERLTFEQTYALAARLAQQLQRDHGVVTGARVAISMRNYPEWVIAFMAVTSIGGIAVAMNSLWQPEEMAYALKDSASCLLLADPERIARFEQIAPAIDIQLISVRGTGEADLLAQLTGEPDCQMPEVALAPNDDATIFYTSGSTGHPKGAVSSHRSVITALLSWELDQLCGRLLVGAEPPELASQNATLLAVPLFHATGSHAVFLSCYRQQRKMVCMYKWDPAQAAALIESEKIVSMIAPAAMTGDLLATAQDGLYDLSSLLSLGGGGAPRAPEQVKRIGSDLANALPTTGWGMTETNAIGTGIGGEDYLAHPESSGRCAAVLDLRIVDESGVALPAGERGELQVRGTTVIRGYWNRPDANAETFVDGWLRTGDIAYLDEAGYLYIVDRLKDLVIRGGENIGCGEVEAALWEHPLILEASVYAVPDERLGEEVGATVYVSETLDEAALAAFLRERIAAFKLPRHLTQTRQPLPRTASGKILKRQLRDEALARL